MSTKRTITITEALAEIKLIDKKLESKAHTVMGNLTRYDHIPDALGDSAKKLGEEMQSMHDLWAEIIKIRSAISGVNLRETIKVGEKTATISEWITWKREIATKQLTLYTNIRNNLKNATDRHATNPQAYKDPESGENRFFKLVCNLPYSEFIEKSQKTQETLDRLDGLLSLKNATVTVEV